MGSHPTLAHDWVGQQTTLASASGAELAFEQLNPHLTNFIDHGDPDGSRERVRTVEDLDTRGYRAWVNDANENPPTPLEVRQLQLQERATTAQASARQLEQAFDRLNPDFGIPADTQDPIGRQDVRDREAALALGVRVAVHDSRQNDRNPVIWQAGQDYRAADAIHAARAQPTRTRHGPERVGPER
jgi:hypothetical protein